MKQRGLWTSACAVSIALSCGGATDDVGTTHGVGGASGSAPGGSSGLGGSSGVPGSGGVGGTSGVGGSGGVSGSFADIGGAGPGGYAGDAGPQYDCSAEPVSFGCAGGGHFYFEGASGMCKSHGLGRCARSLNGFHELADCLSLCAGARPDTAVCDHVTDCAIVDRACCPACEPASPDALIAVNVQRTGDFREPCDPIACEPCPAVDELQRTRAYFVPSCRWGTCGIFDVRDSPFTACSTDSDCRVRNGAECCENCDSQRGLVSVNPSSVALLCDGPVRCAECSPTHTPGYTSQCQNGHCRLIRVVDAGAR